MPAVVTNDETAQRMKERMESTGAVLEVRLNPRIGTILVLYTTHHKGSISLFCQALI